jgi:glucosamine-6-phosphate deaminase
MGIGTIMEAEQVVLLAFGKNKADAVCDSIEGPVSAMMPASILQMHAKVKFLADEDAASKLQHHEYYRWVHTNKPDWQEAEYAAK